MTTDFSNLFRVLEETGYIQNYLTFGDGNLRSWDWERTGRLLQGKARVVWDGLLCGKEVSASQLEKALSKRVLQEFSDQGLCTRTENKVSFGANSLIYSHGFAFFVKRGSLTEGFYGDDSRILLGLRPAQRTGRILCLNSGTGAEALPLAATGSMELHIEAEKGTTNYIRTNLALNGLLERTQLTAANTEKFVLPADVITARVPGFIEFGGIKYPPLVGAGEDGRQKWDNLLRRAQQELTPKGRLAFVGLYYGSKESGQVCSELKKMFAGHGLSASVNISSKLAMEMGIPVFNQTLTFAEMCSKRERNELLETFHKELEERGYSHAYLLKGMAWRAKRGSSASILNLSEHYYGTWLT